MKNLTRLKKLLESIIKILFREDLHNALELSPNVSQIEKEDEKISRKSILNHFQSFPKKYNELISKNSNSSLFDNLYFLENYGRIYGRYCLFCLVQKV